MFCSFLLCWLCWCCESSCWLGLLWIFFIHVMYLILVWGALLKVCWASPCDVQSCFSFCCPIAVDSAPSCSWCWFDDCCPLSNQLCDIWSILCLLWYVECCSGFDVDSFPQISLTNPVVFRCWKLLWSWNACCCVWLLSTAWLLLISCCHLFWSLWLLLCISSLLLWLFLLLLAGCWKCFAWCCDWWPWWSCILLDLKPRFTLPCCVQHPLLLLAFKAVELLLKVFCCAVVLVGYCSPVVLKLVHWNWTLLVWHVHCSALSFVGLT